MRLEWPVGILGGQPNHGSTTGTSAESCHCGDDRKFPKMLDEMKELYLRYGPRVPALSIVLTVQVAVSLVFLHASGMWFLEEPVRILD